MGCWMGIRRVYRHIWFARVAIIAANEEYALCARGDGVVLRGGIMFERINMLIVDDVALNRTPLAALFSEEYDILEAGSGQEALDQLGKHQVDVVLLDVRMPGMDGMEVLRRIKANPATAHIPVIMNTIRGTSTSGDSTVEAEALELGASDFITKPYIPAVVWRRVHNALARTTLNRLELQQELQEVQGRLTSLSSSIPGAWASSALRTACSPSSM